MKDIDEKKFRRRIQILKETFNKKENTENPVLYEDEKEETISTKSKKVITRNKRIIAGLIIFALTTTVIFLRYGGEKLLDQVIPKEQVTYYHISELIGENPIDLAQTMVSCIERHTEADIIFKTAVTAYEKNNLVDMGYITRLEDLKHSKGNLSLPELDELFQEIVDKEIIILNTLKSKEGNLTSVQKRIEELSFLSNRYKESVICVFQDTNIMCKYCEENAHQ